MNTFPIQNEDDIVQTRRAARDLADQLGFSIMDKTRVATSVSELARNTYCHGGGGQMELKQLEEGGRVGISCVFLDEGVGIENIELALTDGFSTGNSLGHGLPGTKRLVDELIISEREGGGTRVEMIKWK